MVQKKCKCYSIIKICKKKNLISPQWLRNVKSKKYSIFRLDALFSNKKYFDINIIEDGGWHFTNIKNAQQIDFKMRNFLHHLEYEESGMTVKDIENSIRDKKIIYDYSADSKGVKQANFASLKRLDLNNLPDYMSKNIDKFSKWID